jgi:acyl-CoA-binding protein
MINTIIANQNARLLEAMGTLKANIISSLAEPGHDDVDVTFFANNILKGLEQDMKEIQENSLKKMIATVERLNAKILSCLPQENENYMFLRMLNVASLAPIKPRMNIDILMANENARIIDALETLKAEIISSFAEPGYVDINDIKDYLAENVLKGLEEDIKASQEIALKKIIGSVELLKDKIMSFLPVDARMELETINVASLAVM